ncbi:MAG: hypothetical protein WCL04_02785 [Verrucomicrobiota bacterium]
MLRRFQIAAVLLAWLLATGSQWDCTQVLAWGRMITHYAHTMPLADAVRLTFTAGNECDICVALADVRQQQSDTVPVTPAAKSAAKILLFVQPAAVFMMAAPETFVWPDSTRGSGLGMLRASPPVPPPRAA